MWSVRGRVRHGLHAKAGARARGAVGRGRKGPGSSIMLSLTKFFGAAIVAAAAGLFAAGCQSSGSNDAGTQPAANAMAMPADAGGQAVTCDTCKVTWVKSP